MHGLIIDVNQFNENFSLVAFPSLRHEERHHGGLNIYAEGNQKVGG